MRISVIMPSYLFEYKGSASNREEKCIRAVNSFLNQTYFEKELVIVSDGCQKTNRLYRAHWSDNKQIKLVELEKQPMFSGNVRQAGLDAATGQILCYLDTDDFIGMTHLSAIYEAFAEQDEEWIYFNDFLYFGKTVSPTIREVILTSGRIGTSNIAHKKLSDAVWTGMDGGRHDWMFVERMMKFHTDYRKVYGMSYQVCHLAESKHDY